jgi:hypothetical protein
MKKTLLSLAALVAVLSVTAACDTGTNVTACTADTDCLTTEICDTVAEQCITPVCADDADCDLANSDSPSLASDCTADADCDAAGGEVCVADGVGATYCVLADSANAGEGCVDLGFEVASIDGKDVCVAASGEACDTGSCVAQ